MREPKTADEKRLLEVIGRIHAGCNLSEWMIPAQEVTRKIQEIVLNELGMWKTESELGTRKTEEAL